MTTDERRDVVILFICSFAILIIAAYLLFKREDLEVTTYKSTLVNVQSQLKVLTEYQNANATALSKIASCQGFQTGHFEKLIETVNAKCDFIFDELKKFSEVVSKNAESSNINLEVFKEKYNTLHSLCSQINNTQNSLFDKAKDIQQFCNEEQTWKIKFNGDLNDHATDTSNMKDNIDEMYLRVSSLANMCMDIKNAVAAMTNNHKMNINFSSPLPVSIVEKPKAAARKNVR
jgi:archaellum component FlaC